jgi:membrane-associated phospholipid phosphatase
VNRISVIFFIFLFCSAAVAQNNDWDEIKETTENFFTAPGDFTSDDWIKIGSAIGITAAASLLDESVRDFSQAHQTPFLDGLFSIDTYSIEAMASLSALMYIYGWAADNSSVRKLGLRSGEAVLFTELVTAGIKITVGRIRPFKADHQYQFEPFGFTFDKRSFPSGHTSFHFAYSTVMANELNNAVWKTAWFATAAVIGLARIYHNVHWFSDVLMGAALGYAIGDFINKQKELQENEMPAENLLPPQITFTIPL